MVERWHPTSDSIMLIAKHPCGEYVRYSDYADLEAQLAEAKADAVSWSLEASRYAKRLDKMRARLSALETTPPAPKVTDEMVEAGARAIAKAWGEDWECCCTERKGLDCDCGDAMTDDRYDCYDERLSRDDCRAASRAAITAARESGQ